MNAQQAIELLTSGELSPSTRDLLALERIAELPERDAQEVADVVAEIVAEYITPPPT